MAHRLLSPAPRVSLAEVPPPATRSLPAAAWPATQVLAQFLQRALALALALLGPAALPASAGSVTAESIWDQNNALQRALRQVPAGAAIKRQQCETIGVGFNNERYRCTVEFVQPPKASSPATPPSPSPAPAQAPAPTAAP